LDDKVPYLLYVGVTRNSVVPGRISPVTVLNDSGRITDDLPPQNLVGLVLEVDEDE
jgi:hypothetical protein